MNLVPENQVDNLRFQHYSHRNSTTLPLIYMLLVHNRNWQKNNFYYNSVNVSMVKTKAAQQLFTYIYNFPNVFALWRKLKISKKKNAMLSRTLLTFQLNKCSKFFNDAVRIGLFKKKIHLEITHTSEQKKAIMYRTQKDITIE